MTTKSVDLAHSPQRRPGRPRRGRQDDAGRAAAVPDRRRWPGSGRVDDGTAAPRLRARGAEAPRVAERSRSPRSTTTARVTLVDTPGYPDFVAEVISGMAAGDGALFVVDASGGVEAGLETAVAQARSSGRAACFFINKCDRENADPDRGPRRAADGVRDEDRPAPAGDRRGRVVQRLRRPRPSQGLAVGRQAGGRDPDPGRARGRGRPAPDQLLEAAAEADDDVLTKYLEGEEISDAELEACLRKGVKESVLAPVLVGSATKGIGLRGLLDAFVRYLPSPADEPPRRPATRSRATRPAVAPDPAGPLLVRVFKTAADPFVGRLTYLRIVSGHAPRPGSRLEREPRRGRADRPAAPAPRQGPGAGRRAQGRRDRGGRQADGDRDRRHA